jgi:hypothetical protein
MCKLAQITIAKWYASYSFLHILEGCNDTCINVLGDVFCVVQSVTKRAESTTRDLLALGFGGYEFPFIHINEQLRSMLI